MSKVHIKTKFESRLEHSFRRMWVIASVVALIAGIPVVLYKDQGPRWLAVAVFIAILVGIILEVRDDVIQKRRSKQLVRAREEQGLEAKSDFGRLYTTDVARRFYVDGSVPIQIRLNTTYPVADQIRQDRNFDSQASETTDDYSRITPERLLTAVGTPA